MTDQAMSALAQANEIRQAMGRLRQRFATEGFELAARSLRDPDETLARMRVIQFLTALPRVGNHRASRFLQDAQICAGALQWRVGPLSGPKRQWAVNRTLTRRQREALARVLQSFA